MSAFLFFPLSAQAWKKVSMNVCKHSLFSYSKSVLKNPILGTDHSVFYLFHGKFGKLCSEMEKKEEFFDKTQQIPTSSKPF